jgi:hypothetical protein
MSTVRTTGIPGTASTCTNVGNAPVRGIPGGDQCPDEAAMRPRLALIACGGAAVAAVDLAVKAALTTPPLLVHERSPAWLVGSLALAAGCAALAAVASRLVACAAALTAGGLLGNAVSALTNRGGVPDPLLLGGARHGIAFNLADVFFLCGLGGVLGAAVVAARRGRIAGWRPWLPTGSGSPRTTRRTS